MLVSQLMIVAALAAWSVRGTAPTNIGSRYSFGGNQSLASPHIVGRDLNSLKKNGFREVSREELSIVLSKSTMSPMEENIMRETDFSARFLPNGLMRKTEFEIVTTTRELKWRIYRNFLCVADSGREICRAALISMDSSMLALSAEDSKNGVMDLYKLAQNKN